MTSPCSSSTRWRHQCLRDRAEGEIAAGPLRTRGSATSHPIVLTMDRGRLRFGEPLGTDCPVRQVQVPPIRSGAPPKRRAA